MQRGVRLRPIKDARERYDAVDPLLWRRFSVIDEMNYGAANAPVSASEWITMVREVTAAVGAIPIRPFIAQIPARRVP